MIQSEKSCLVLIDVQKKLVNVMYNKEQLIKNCSIMLQIANALKIPILWCQQVPTALGPTVDPLPEHLAGLESIDKKTFSCYRDKQFRIKLKDIHPETAILCGIESHVCIYQTASDLLANGINVHIIADAVSSRTPENYQIGVDRIVKEGAVISSTEMVLFELLKTAEHEKFKLLANLIR